MSTILRNLEDFLGKDSTPLVETSLNLEPNLVDAQVIVADADLDKSDDEDEQIRNYRERLKRHDQIEGAHKRRRHNIDIHDHMIDSQNMLLRVLSMILHGKKEYELPCSVAYIYNISESLCHNSNFASVMYQKEDEIFDTEIASTLRKRNSMGDKEVIKEFIKSFTDWLAILRRLQIVFTIFDESPNFRTHEEKRRIIPFWITKFGRVVLEPLFNGDSDSCDKHFMENGLMKCFLQFFVTTYTVYDPPSEQMNEDYTLVNDFFDILKVISDNTKHTEPLNLTSFFKHAAAMFVEKFDSTYEEPSQFVSRLKFLLLKLRDFKGMICVEMRMHIDPLLCSICKGCLTSNFAKQNFLKIIFEDLIEFRFQVEFVYSVQEKYRLNLHAWESTKSFIEKKLTIMITKQKCETRTLKLYGSEQVMADLINFSKNLEDILAKYVRMSSVALVIQNVLKRTNSENFVAEALARYMHRELINVFNTAEESSEDKDLSISLRNSEVENLSLHCSMIFSMIPGKRNLVTAIYENILRKELLYGSIIVPTRLKNDCIQLVREEFAVRCMGEKFGLNVNNSLLAMIHDLQKSNLELYKFISQSKTQFKANFCCLKKEDWTKELPGEFVQLPYELTDVACRYQKSLNKQKFEWYYQLQRVTLNVLFNENDSHSLKEIECSSYQAAIFLAFQNRYVISLKELQSITKMELQFLEGNLKLLVGKKMLLYRTKKKTYEINSKFMSDKKVIKLHNYINKKKKFQLTRTGMERDDFEMMHMRITCFITRKLKADSPIEYLKLVEDILHYLVESNVNFKEILACHDTDIHAFIKNILDELTGEVYIRRVNDNYYEYVP